MPRLFILPETLGQKLAQYTGNVLRTFGVGGSASAANTLANNISDMLIAGDRSRFAQAVNQNKNKGMTQEQAIGAATVDSLIIQPLESYAEGGATAAVMSIPGTAGANAAIRSQINSYVDNVRNSYSTEGNLPAMIGEGGYGTSNLPALINKSGGAVPQNRLLPTTAETQEITESPDFQKLPLSSQGSQKLLKGAEQYTALPDEGYNDYVQTMGGKALTYDKYIEQKNTSGDSWNELQAGYTIRKIANSYEASHPAAVALQSGDPIPPELSEAANNLYYSKQQGIYHYTEHDVGVEINKYLGGVKGIRLMRDEFTIMEETADALDDMSLPFDMIVYKGCSPVTFSGLKDLEQIDTKKWTGQILTTKSFTSTSVYPDTAYEGEVVAIIHIPGGEKGAGYVNYFIQFEKWTAAGI